MSPTKTKPTPPNPARMVCESERLDDERRVLSHARTGEIIVTGARKTPGVTVFSQQRRLAMKTIQTTIEVDDERRATIQLPADLPPGPYQAVVVIEDSTGHAATPADDGGFPAA